MRPKINSMNEENVGADNLNTAEEVTLDVTEETTTQDENVESVEEVKSRLAKAEELANNYKIRAEKAERLAKETKQIKPEVKQESKVSTQDVIALMKANVAEDDVSEVEKYASYQKISIADALKSPVMKAILADRTEKRNTANATNTGGARRSPGKVTDDAILEKARRGEIPDTDEGMAALARAKMAERRGKK